MPVQIEIAFRYERQNDVCSDTANVLRLHRRKINTEEGEFATYLSNSNIKLPTFKPVKLNTKENSYKDIK